MRRLLHWFSTIVVLIMVCAVEADAGMLFVARLDGDQEIPPPVTSANGFGRIELNDAEDMITVNLSFQNLLAAQTAAHIHGPASLGVNGPVIITLPPGLVEDFVTPITSEQADHLKSGLLYFNVHSSQFPGGEIRGQITRKYLSGLFVASLQGDQMVPPVLTAANGFGSVALNDVEDQITVNLSFQNLLAVQTAAHIHGPADIGVNGPVQISLPLGQVSDFTFLITPTQVVYLKSGLLYFNVHSSMFPAGEIRGQITHKDRAGMDAIQELLLLRQ